MRWLTVGLLGVGLAWSAPTPLGAQTYHADIRPLLRENCVGCHSEGGVAFTLEDDDRAYGRRRAIGRAILDRKMPPWLAEAGHQHYVDDPSLSAEQIALVSQWVANGYERGTPRPSTRRPALAPPFRPDVSVPVLGGESYLPDQTRSDDYRCFVVEWPGQEPGYITGFRAVPGNLHVAHHVVVYAIDPTLTERYAELDSEEEGLGYQCFGGAVPDRFDSRAERDAYESRYPDGVRQLHRGNFWLAHWAPGMDGYAFPEGTGIRMRPGAGLVVQMHYYSEHAPGEGDADTMLDFQVAAEVERPAIHFPLTEGDWIFGRDNGSMVVEPHSTASVETSERLGDLVPYLAYLAGVEEERVEALEVHSANLHMHSYGHSGTVTLTDEAGNEEILLSIPRWDLGWQRDFTFVEPKVFPLEVAANTRLTVRCNFENPTEETVYGGYGSDEEMCFNFSYIAVQVSETNVASPTGR